MFIKVDPKLRSELKFLKGSKLAIYLALGLRVNGDGSCWPSGRKIAEDTGYSIREVRYAIGELEKMGFVRVERMKEGGWRRNTYYLNGMFRYGSEKEGPCAVNAPPSAEIASPSANTDSNPSAFSERYKKKQNKKELLKKNTEKGVQPPPPKPEITEIFEWLEALRGYPSPCYEQEKLALEWIFDQGFSIDDIHYCYWMLAADLWYNGKLLSMDIVKRHIGAQAREDLRSNKAVDVIRDCLW
jgi:DNA-binding transcriptional ArsR family regulator